METVYKLAWGQVQKAGHYVVHLWWSHASCCRVKVHDDIHQREQVPDKPKVHWAVSGHNRQDHELHGSGSQSFSVDSIFDSILACTCYVHAMYSLWNIGLVWKPLNISWRVTYEAYELRILICFRIHKGLTEPCTSTQILTGHWMSYKNNQTGYGVKHPVQLSDV